MNMEADSMHLKEESTGHNNCSDEKRFGSISRDDLLITEVSLTNDVVDHEEEDLNRKIRIEAIEKLIQKKNEARSQLAAKFQHRKVDRQAFHRSNNNRFKWLIAYRMKQMEVLQQCLQELQRSNNSGRKRLIDRCSPLPMRGHGSFDVKYIKCEHSSGGYFAWNEECNYLQQCLQGLHRLKNPERRSKSLYYRMQHGSNSLAEEKKLLREIKQNEEASREKVTTNSYVTPQIPHYLGSRKDISARIESIRDELKILKKRDQALAANEMSIKGGLEAIESDISSLERKLLNINREKGKAYESILQLIKMQRMG